MYFLVCVYLVLSSLVEGSNQVKVALLPNCLLGANFTKKQKLYVFNTFFEIYLQEWY